MKIVAENTGALCERVFSGRMPYGTAVSVPVGCEAVFVRGGQVIDVLRAGEHTVNARTGFTLRSAPKETCEVYSVARSRPFDILWGVGGIVSGGRTYGVSGTYRVSVDNPQSLLRTFGFRDRIDADAVRSALKSAVSDAVRESFGRPDLSAAVKTKLTGTALYYGLFLESFHADEIMEVGAREDE